MLECRAYAKIKTETNNKIQHTTTDQTPNPVERNL